LFAERERQPKSEGMFAFGTSNIVETDVRNFVFGFRTLETDSGFDWVSLV